MKPAGLILAGGGGNRLGGVVKAELRVGGVPLLARVAAALGTCAPILVAYGQVDPSRCARPGLVLLADPPPPPEGPLAGLVAASDWLAIHEPRAEAVLSVAVDTPFFPADFAGRMASLLAAGAPAAIGAFAGQDYPTNALWRLSTLREALRDPPASLFRLATRLGAARLDWAGFTTENPFANVNTVADLVAANRRAGPPEPRPAEGKFGLGKAGQSR